MPTVNDQIGSASDVICRNIDELPSQRDLLSQNILSQMRNLVEGMAVRLHTGIPDAEFTYDATKPALSFVKSNAKFNFLGKFHKLLQISASHYTLEGDASERLMLKYYEYLLRIRGLLRDECGIETLSNLEKFPLNIALAQDFRTVAGAGIMVPEGGPTDGRTIEAEAAVLQFRV